MGFSKVGFDAVFGKLERRRRLGVSAKGAIHVAVFGPTVFALHQFVIYRLSHWLYSWNAARIRVINALSFTPIE